MRMKKAKNESKICVTCQTPFDTFTGQVECKDCCWKRVTARLTDDPKAAARFVKAVTRR